MEFTENQKAIFGWLHNANRSYSFIDFLYKYLETKFINLSFDDSIIPSTLTISGLNIEKELYDILKVWNCLIKQNLVTKKYDIDPTEYSDNPIYAIYTEGHHGINYTLTHMAAPLWDMLFFPSFAFDEYCNNHFMDNVQIERVTNEIRLKEEREERIKADNARRKGIRWTVIAVLSSIILGLTNTCLLLFKDNRIKKIESFPDTVKVMYYNPPKDSLK